jgi:hypothetical protein
MKRFRILSVLMILALSLPVLAQDGAPKDPPTDGPTKVGTQPQTLPANAIRQWAVVASASSEYPSWDASQATGAPNIRGCVDEARAWASETAVGEEFILLFYEIPVIPLQINVHQNYGPGAIVGLGVGNTATDVGIDLPDSDDAGTEPCPRIFSYDVSTIDDPMDSVGVFLDQSITGGWNEIDAVELVGIPVEGAPGGVNPTTATPTDTPPANVPTDGIEVTCPDGVSFSNGSEVVINMRPGFSYTATAIGVGDFDPILAIRDEDGRTLCSDDDSDGAAYIANLPTTGPIGPSNRTAHKPFTYSGSALGNVSFIVGSFNSTAGEFVLIIEGLAVTSSDGRGDGAGDPFYVNVTPNVIASGVPITAYSIAVTSALDTLLSIVDEDDLTVVLDDGSFVSCDDAGNTSLCYGLSERLDSYYVSRTNGRRVPGGQYDSMLQIPSDVFDPDGVFVEYRFSSSEQRTFGDYVAVFHMGTVEGR